MANKKFLLGILVLALVFGMTVVGCGGDDSPVEVKYNNVISSVSISLYFGDTTPKVGNRLSTSVLNSQGTMVQSSSNVTYQWKRADSQYSTFTNISSATSSSYTPVIEDAGKWIKVEAKNTDTSSPVESSAVGPVDANKVATPTADPNGGSVVTGQGITLASATEDATIRYTLDGTTPTSSSSLYADSDYFRPKITSNCTLKAIATKYGMVDSEVLSVSYTVVAAPTFTAVTSSASTFGNGLYSIAYGNSTYVVGGNIKMAYSSNGTTWTDATVTGAGFPLVRGITYGGTKFVAVGDYYGGGIINYSTNGSSWDTVTTTTFGTSYIKDVAYGGSKYVAVGENGKMAYSSDGTNWTAVSTSTFGTSTIYGITYAAGKFVAVGASGKIAYSTDGTTWTAVTDSKFSTYAINSITYGGPSGKEMFVAVGGFGSYRISYSTDGINWISISQYLSGGIFAGLNKVTWGGNKFVAVADNGVMLYSLDGTYWANIDGGTGTGKTQFDTNSSSSINGIVYASGKFLAVGSKYVSSTSTTGEMAISNNQ